MKSRIIVKNEIGREVNPHPEGRRVMKPFFEEDWIPDYKHEEFERTVKSYPAPGIKDGEWEAELITIPSYSGYTIKGIREGLDKQVVYVLAEQKGTAHNKELDRLIKMVKSGGYKNESDIVKILEVNRK